MPSPARPFILGYYPDWSANLAPAAIDFRLFTHICHAFAVVRRNGAVKFPDTTQSKELCTRAQAAGVRVMLSIGGEDSGPAFAVHTVNADSVARLADTLTAQVAVCGYDGIDVDWEFPTNADESARMAALVRSLRERLPRGATLTMATPATDWSGKWFRPDDLLPHLDFANVMTYDFHGSWSSRAGYLAPLYASPHDPDTRPGDTVEGAMDYWLGKKRWPAEKLLMGIPLYGAGFHAARWGDKPSAKFPDDTDLSYNAVKRLIAKGWRRVPDAVAKTPTLQNPDGTTLISYEDTDSAALKGAYAKRRGLGGIFFWDISNDFDGRTNPVVRAAREGVRGIGK